MRVARVLMKNHYDILSHDKRTRRVKEEQKKNEEKKMKLKNVSASSSAPSGRPAGIHCPTILPFHAGRKKRTVRKHMYSVLPSRLPLNAGTRDHSRAAILRVTRRHGLHEAAAAIHLSALIGFLCVDDISASRYFNDVAYVFPGGAFSIRCFFRFSSIKGETVLRLFCSGSENLHWRVSSQPTI